jgi:hypothetical protein
MSPEGFVMIHRDARDFLADSIHALVAGYVSNDQFEDAVINRLGPLRSYDSDPAIWAVFDGAWNLYTDLYEYRLVGPNRLTARGRHEVLRWVLFLRSEQEYEWPWLRSGCLLSMLTLGIEPRIRRARWRRAGDFDVWPFLRRSHYESVYRQHCPFAVFVLSFPSPPDW